MINLGFYSGGNMPNVYLKLTLIDRILEGLAILLTVVAWVFTIVLYLDSPDSTAKLFVAPIVMTLTNALFLWASRAPIRFYRFPVKLNEQNYVMQYFIACRFIRIINPIITLLLICGLSIEFEPLLSMGQGFFYIATFVIAGILFISFIVYYIMAYRYR